VHVFGEQLHGSEGFNGSSLDRIAEQSIELRGITASDQRLSPLDQRH
jgi:hypothetical protein